MSELGPATKSLWKRSFGGQLVADSPNSGDLLDGLSGEASPDLREALDYFVTRRDSSDCPAYLFLVGGPGAGKSSIAKTLVSHLEEVDPPHGSLAARTHKYSGKNRQQVLLNDATMSEEGVETSLKRDIRNCLDSGSDLIACINRGVFVEELANEDQLTECDPILEFAAGQGDLELLDFEEITDRGTWRIGRMNLSGKRVALIAVYLDSSSLLRSHTKLDAGQQITNFPAVELLRQLFGGVFEETMASPAPEPVQSNIKNLQNPRVFENFVKLLGSAEVASGSFFTWRTLWGIASRALFAGLPGAFPVDNPYSGLPDDVEELSFAQLRDFSVVRSHQSIYGAKENDESLLSGGASSQTRVFERVDPLRSSLVDVVNSVDQTFDRDGWLTTVTEAFFNVDEGVSPLRSLIRSLKSDDPFLEYVTDFDQKLDSSFLEELNVTSPGAARQYLVSWYAQYLVRAYAFANGHIGNQAVVSLLEEILEFGDIPDQHDLGRRILALLRPRRYPGETDGSALLSLLDSRVSPILGDLAEPKLAIKAIDLNVSVERRGGDLVLQLNEHGKQVGEVNLDFELIHEALAWLPGFAGMTESASAVIPRMERLRATRLTTKNLQSSSNSIVVALETSDRQFKLKLGSES